MVSVRYGLAPEHPFPVALDQLTAAWDWLQAGADGLCAAPDRVALGGESAGGGLAAALAQRLLDTRPTQPIAQWLFAPMLDDRTAADRSLDAVDHRIWNNVMNRVGWSAYLGDEPGSPALPEYAAPARRQDLRGLSPVYLAVGDIELFHDEVVDYGARLTGAGVPVTLDVVPGGPHGFENWARTTPPAVALVRRAQDWLRSVIADA